MSAPIGRETPARKTTTQHRKIEALARRPAPAESIAGELPWAYLGWTVGADITSGAWTDPGDVSGDWESFENDAGASLFSHSLTGGTLTAGSAGLYHAHAIASWTDTPAAGSLGLRILPAAAGNPVANPTSEAWADATRVLTDGAIGAMTHDSFHAVSASSVTFSALVFQNTGAALFLNFLVLYVVKLATVTGTFDP